MRGKGLSELAHTKKARITPACAGKTTSVLPSTLPATDHPRVCGENFQDLAAQYEKAGSPPRVRGKRNDYRPGTIQVRITPACAGKTLSPALRVSAPTDHPRVCGENGTRASKKRAPCGSPPRMRGKHIGAACDYRGVRITPAHAGKTLGGQGSLP